MVRTALMWPILVGFSAMAMGILVFTQVETPVRFWIAAWFVLVCPGMAFVPLLRLHNSATEWSLAVALSLTINMFVAMALLYVGRWSPEWALAIVIALCSGGVVLQIITSFPHATGLAQHVSITVSSMAALVVVLFAGAWLSVPAQQPFVMQLDALRPTPTALPTATPTALPTATPTALPTATPTALPTATPTVVPLTATRLLEPGMRGADVVALQARLRSLGYFSYPVNTGYYGSETQRAVIEFQRQRGIITTGLAGPLTVEALNACDQRCALVASPTREDDP